MRKLYIFVTFLFFSVTCLSQVKDTIFVTTKTATIVRFKGAVVQQYDITGSVTDDKLIAPRKDLFYSIDSAAGILKFKAVKPFTNKAILTAIFDTAFQYYIKFSENPDKSYYEFRLPSETMSNKKNQEPPEETNVNASIIPSESVSANGINGTKRKLFATARARQPNMYNVSTFDRQISIVLSKIYQEKEASCFSFGLINHLRSPVELGSIEVALVVGETTTIVPAAIEESAFASLGKWEKTSFSVIVDNLKMPIGSILRFTLKYKDAQYSDLNIDVKQKKFETRELMY